jgi:heme-degrading monooxygenase HmoA
MVRVVYRWRVTPGRHQQFAAWWHAGTIRIRHDQPGALGSTLCRAADDADCFVGIARWESRRAVEAFWSQATGDGFEGAALESIEVLDELDDLTLGPGPA